MPSLTLPPISPDPGDPSTYAKRTDDHIAWRKINVEELNVVLPAIDAKQEQAIAAATIATVKANEVVTKASEVEISATNAAAAAASAVNAPGTSSTSATSVALTAGSKTLTTQTGKTYPIGASVKFARTSDVTKWAVGTVVSYDGITTGQLVLSVDENDINGTGIFTDWTLSISGHRGAPGVAAIAPGLIPIFTAIANNHPYVEFIGLSTEYDEYEIHFQSVTPMGTAKFYSRASKTMGASYLTSGYVGAGWGAGQNENPSFGDLFPADKAVVFQYQSILPQASNPSAGISGVIKLFRPAHSRYFIMRADVSASRAGNPYNASATTTCDVGAGGVCNAIQLFFDSANIEAGFFKLYGVRKP